MVDACDTGAKDVLNSNFTITSTIYLEKTKITKHVLNDKYTQNGLSMREIARLFSCSKTHVRDKLIEFKIPIRPTSKTSLERNPRAFGKHKVGSRVINNQKEQTVIKAILKMYGDGLLPTEIAKTLNIMNVPTKQNGKKWHHHSIITILKRHNKYKTNHKEGN